MSKRNTLIFLTAEFPYGKGETFIENEFPSLKDEFQKIIIVTNTKATVEKRISNEDADVHYFPFELTSKEKIYSLKGVLTKEFWAELTIIRNDYQLNLNPTILKTLLTSLYKKNKINSFLSKLLIEKKLKTDNMLIYSYWLNDMAIGLAEFKKNNPSVKAISRAHGWDVYRNRHADNYLPLRHFLLNNLDAYFSISNNGKLYLNELSKNKFTSKIKLSRLGTINIKGVSPINEIDTLHIVSCSNLIPLKRVHLIIEAISLLDTPVNWTHFGDGILRAELEAFAKNKFAEKPTISCLFKGQVSNQDVIEFYATHPVDLFINVSESEGIPVSIMEAMSFGIPCIATDVGGTSEIVTNENGFLIPVTSSAETIKNAMLDYLHLSNEERFALKQNARTTWDNQYNANQNYHLFIEDIRNL